MPRKTAKISLEQLAYLRAAWGYRERDRRLTFLEGSLLKEKTVRGWFLDPPRLPSYDDALEFVRLCGVPEQFLDAGFESLREPVGELEVSILKLRGELAGLQRTVATLEANQNETRELVEISRLATGAVTEAADASADGPPESTTRDATDATTESSEAGHQRKPPVRHRSEA